MDPITQNRIDLKAVVYSPGGKYLLAHIEEEIVAGWEKFIALPVEKKTSKASYDAQARYKVLKDLRDWIDTESKMAD